MQNFSTFIVFVACLVYLGAAEFKSKHLPSYITACMEANPNADDCSKKAANAAVPYLIKGDKAYKIPSLLPLKVPKLVLSSGDNLKLTLTDVSIFGLDGMTIEKLHIDPVKKHCEVIIVDKWINVDSQYNIDGHILVLPISGSGPANLTFYDSTFRYNMDYELTKKSDGKEYVRITKSDTDIDIPKAYFNLENLFNGNKALGEHMNNFLNENSREVVKELGVPVLKELIEVIINQVLNAILRVVPYEEVLVPK